jgi:hypothetical protein
MKSNTNQWTKKCKANEAGWERESGERCESQRRKNKLSRVAFHSVTSHIFGNGISPISDVPVLVFSVSITRCVHKFSS